VADAGVMLKGTLASGFCSPPFTWAQAATDARIRSNTAFANLIVISPCFSRSSIQALHPERSGALLFIVYHHRDRTKFSGLFSLTGVFSSAYHARGDFPLLSVMLHLYRLSVPLFQAINLKLEATPLWVH
jgi:hypothetical protein